MKDIEIKEYMDEKFDKLELKHRNRQQWVTTLIVFVIIALISSGYMNARAIGGIQTKTEMIYKGYVPGDLFIAVVHSFDLQNRYTLSLLNGQREEAEKAYNEFIEFRDQIYETHFKTRSYISPTEGKVAKKSLTPKLTSIN